MKDELRRALGFFVGVVVLGGAAAILLPRLLGAASGPETELITQLKASERQGVTLEVPGTKTALRSRKHQFDRLSVTVDLTQREGTVTATLDFEGSFGNTQVSSLGAERVRFRYQEGDFEPAEGVAPRLAAVVGALEQRRAALERGDRDALARLTRTGAALEDPALAEVLKLTDRRYRALAWFIRSEREEVLVTEEFQLSGTLPDRPVDTKGSRRLSLTRDGREMYFAGSLM